MSVVPQQVTQKPKNVMGLLFVIMIIVVGLAWFINLSTQRAKQAALKVRNETISVPSEDEAKVVAKKEIADILAKVQFVNPRIENNIIDQPELRVTLKNNTGKDIDGVVMEFTFKNNFGEDVTSWGGKSVSGSRYQGVIKVGGSEDLSNQLFEWSGATKVNSAKVVRIHFVDGTDIQEQ